MATNKKMPTSRAARTAVVGRVVAGQAVRQAGTRAANLARSEERGKRAIDRRNAEAVKSLVDALGLMKGAAMKVGQMLSVIDAGMVPEEFRDEFQRSLAKLQNAAPSVSFKDMRKVIESDLDARIKDLFATFDETPIGTASIGQVYRATLHDGREVAVKVQYPGVSAAVRADLQNLSVIMRAMKLVAPGLDGRALTQEIRERIEEELDYELEAQNQRAVARQYRRHPFIYVPEVVTSMSTERVLVTEFVHGKKFADIRDEPQETRDRVAEIVFRFYSGGLYRHCQFSPDPHPGNFLLADDGRVAFLDFGLYKRMAAAKVELELKFQRALSEGDAGEVHRLLTIGGFIPHPERVSTERGDRLRARGVLVVHDRRGDRPDAGDRQRGGVPGRQPGIQPLRQGAPPADAARAPVRPADGADGPVGAEPAQRASELAPDRARVDVRRAAGDRARPPRRGVPGRSRARRVSSAAQC